MTLHEKSSSIMLIIHNLLMVVYLLSSNKWIEYITGW